MRVSDVFSYGSRHGGYDDNHYDHSGHSDYRRYNDRDHYGRGHRYSHNYSRRHYGGLISLDIL
jgi:hypothetical protein